MDIIGASIFGYNPSACLVRDGELIAFAEEERFTRIKTANGAFPINAILYCLREGKINFDGINYIAVGWDANKYPGQMKAFFERGWQKYGEKGPTTRSWEARCLALYEPANMHNAIKQQFATRGYYGKLPEVRFIDHHLSHAASTFFPSGMEKAAILTIDGSGEDRTTCIFKGDGANIEQVDAYEIPDSLGWFYSTMTQFCGFQHNIDEGKLMGLAPYGSKDAKVRSFMDRVVKVNGQGRYVVDPTYTYYGEHMPGKGFAKKLVDDFGPPRELKGEFSSHYKNVAWAAQDKLEEVGTMLADQAMKRAGSRNLCIAGGVGLNCKMNGVINTKGGVDELFVQPISSDAGTAVGAALWLHRELTGKRPKFIQQHMYYGPGYSDDDIERVLKECKLSYVKSSDIAKDIAHRLADGKLVSWFQGRMEGGPRALGHRSILAHAGYPDMKAKINREVKHREMWRPFCPSILAEKRQEWLLDSDDAPYMIVAQWAQPDKMHKIPAVVHEDGSVRPQMVHEQIEPLYHRLISEFDGLTGLPMVLNTSLNIMGEPMICTPDQAIRCFYSTGLDVMGIGSFILEK